jgi:hypothetical protein
MTDRWALYVDVEGFGAKWNETTTDAFRGINGLMEGIFRIGVHCYAEPPDRLFAHQFGDAFLLVSDFHESVLDRAVLVGFALMRQLLALGEIAKCTMDEGELSDISNCYPEAIRKRYNSGHIDVGAGLMTITPVMGTALIRTAAIQKRVSGPLFAVRKALADRVSPSFGRTDIGGGELVSLNWLRGEPPGLRELQDAAGLLRSAEEVRVNQLRSYLQQNSTVSADWTANATTHLIAPGA